MSTTPDITEVFYPESDGEPMGETDLHRDWMIRILELLKWRYRDQQAYVASDLLVYYVEGEPRTFVVPDAFVALGCTPGRRRVFKTWEEGKAPDVVFEVTSRSTRRRDEHEKPRQYAEIGVREYFLYDPEADYLHPPLHGYRQSAEGFARIPQTDEGLLCETLGLWLQLQGNDLEFRDCKTDEPLLTEAETERMGREAEHEARLNERNQRLVERREKLVERTARLAAEERNRELQAELDRLRGKTAE